MTSSIQSKFLVCPPPEKQESKVWERWSKALTTEILDYGTLEDIGRESDISLLVFFGTDLLRQFIQQSSIGYFLNNKIIYHIGGANDEEIKTLTKLGIKAYLGYKGHCPTLIINREEEDLFRDALLAGLKTLCQQKDFSSAVDATERAWRELIVNRRGSPYDQLVRAYALNNFQHLTAFGDSRWSSLLPPRLINLRRTTPGIDSPRVEIVDLSPIMLDWLREDPARIAQMSPDKFEDLIADRLTRVGLCVTKTGSTFTPDGGIDLIAYPKSSSVPYLLAAQIKHSRTNRPVSANVVRDFRGAITALPIDIGMIVTNTEFTPTAEWTARQLPRIIRLRHFEDLKMWLTDEIDESLILKDMPSTVEVAPGLVIPIPWSIK